MIVPDMAEYEESDSTLAKLSLLRLHEEIRLLKDECCKKRKDNKSLRGTIKSILETSNNRHNEIKRLLKKIEKLELKHKQLKDLDKTQVAISKLLKEKEELKKWLEQIQDYHIEMRSSADNQFNECLEVECINVLQDVMNKIKELENGKNEC